VLSGRGLCDKLITHPEESYRLCCGIVCDLETSRIGAPYIYDISSLRVNSFELTQFLFLKNDWLLIANSHGIQLKPTCQQHEYMCMHISVKYIQLL